MENISRNIMEMKNILRLHCHHIPIRVLPRYAQISSIFNIFPPCPLKLKSTKHATFRDGNEKSPLEDLHFLKLEKRRRHLANKNKL